VKRLFETSRVFTIVFSLGLFTMSARGVADPDFWWHLRSGELIVRTHTILRTDPFSFTRIGHPWINHEWLSDLLIFSVYRVTGFAGLIVSFAAISAATLLLVYLRCPGRPYVGALFTVCGAVASTPTWGVRPQMFTLLLAAIFLVILDRSRSEPKILWWTVPLMLLWANLHAGYALGIALLALSLVGTVLDIALGVESWAGQAARLRNLGLALVACMAVVAVNPNGVRLYTYPFETLGSEAMQSYIHEWFSPNFHDPEYVPLLLIILGILVGLAISPKRVSPHELLLLCPATLAGLRSVRHIPVFVLIAVPILAEFWEAWLQSVGATIRANRGSVRRMSKKVLLNAVILGTFAVFSIVRVALVIHRQPRTEAEHFPAGATAFISTQRPPAPMLNHYNWGGYFIWKLYPDYQVFFDGRADLYGDSFMAEFAASCYLIGDWRKSLREWGIRTIILPPDAPLVTALQSRPDWTRAYADSQTVVLIQISAQAGTTEK
jgi:hypothetical protein